MNRIGSLCTGIGGLDLAAQAILGGEIEWCAEIDKHAQTVITERLGDPPNLGDIKALDLSTIPPVDVLTAGYPCQPFSFAGKRKGSNDDKHLWPAVRDIIGHLRPRVVILENVRGHLSLGFEQALADLAHFGMDARWSTVQSASIGAPHRRERLFVVAYSDSRGEDQEVQEQEGRRRIDRQDNGPSEPSPSDWWGEYADSVARWEQISGIGAPYPVDGQGRLNPELPEWMMGYPRGWVTALDIPRTAQLRLIGNAVQPQAALFAVGSLDRIQKRVQEAKK